MRIASSVAGDDVVERGLLRGRRERHAVGHPLERHRPEVLGVRRPARALLADPGSLLSRRLVSDEEAVLDDVEALRLLTVVVVAARGEPARRGLVAVHREVRAAVAELAELVGRRERRPREVGLVAHRAVELGRVADRLVNDEPQVRRGEDDVALSRLHRWRHVQLRDGVLGDLPTVRGGTSTR